MNHAAEIEQAAARASLYALFAALFDRPLDAAGLTALRDPSMSAALAAAGINPGADFGTVNAVELRERLSIEFSHIFVAPVGKIMPYEGLMISGEDELSGDAAARVARFMADVGYRLPPESGQVADHIAVELAFMADLARREVAALADSDLALATRAREIQRDFLRHHLGRWSEIFANKVQQRGGTGFYAMLASALAAFVASETEDEMV